MPRKYVRYATSEKIAKINPINITAIKKYFAFKNMNLSDVSKKNYESDYNQWLIYIMENYENISIESLLNQDGGIDEMVDIIEDFIAFCTSVLGNNERRIQRRMSSISSFFLYLKKKRRIRENPVEYLDRPRIGKGEKPQVKQTFLTLEQVREIRNGLEKKGDIQLYLFFELGLSTMARVNAISNIKLEQIDFKRNRIDDVLEKEGYIVTLFPSTRTMELIKDWLKYREEHGFDSEYLFITRYGGQWKKVDKATMQTVWIKKIGGLINVPELHVHDLRHSGSDLLYHHKGFTLEEIQELLHHKSPSVTKDFYLQTNYEKIQEKKNKADI